MLGPETDEVILLRGLWQGRVRGAYPTYVVESDGYQLLGLFYPANTTYVRSGAPGGDSRDCKLGAAWTVVERVSSSHSLIVTEPCRWFSAWLMWTTSWEFGGYYVNFEEPWRKTSRGYDTRDLALDLIVTPDGQRTWKDREEFDALVENGAIDEASADAVLAECERVVDEVSGERGAFEPVHKLWRSYQSFDPPSLPSDWARIGGSS